jgi:hypothetical protein
MDSFCKNWCHGWQMLAVTIGELTEHAIGIEVAEFPRWPVI